MAELGSSLKEIVTRTRAEIRKGLETIQAKCNRVPRKRWGKRFVSYEIL